MFFEIYFSKTQLKLQKTSNGKELMEKSFQMSYMSSVSDVGVKSYDRMCEANNSNGPRILSKLRSPVIVRCKDRPMHGKFTTSLQIWFKR